MITIPGSCFIRVFGLGKTCPQSFEEPSNKILEKCGGLPLAIISVASLLACQSNRSISQWNYVFNSLRSNLSSNPTLEGMREILNLSYTHLPHHLKTCLLYIGLYLEDHEIRKDYLVMQWVAEGFISGLDGIDALEIAGSYFNELVNRSMIIQFVEHHAWNKEHTYYKVHDMVLNLIVTKSTEENFLSVVENLRTITSRQQSHRLSLQFAESRLDECDPHMSLAHIRSLFIFGLSFSSLQLLDLKFLRVLFICNVDSLDLTPIGKLFQLRFLYIKSLHKHKSDVQLPRQICGLQHLETLIIDAQLSLLPPDIVHLPALSFLKVSVSIACPDGLDNMKSLCTLGNFDPSKQSLGNLRALGELQNLRELDIAIVDYSFITKESQMDALLFSIEKLINYNLRHLTIMALDDLTGYYDGWNSLHLSCSHLEQLHLWLPFPRLPGWIGQLTTLSSLDIHIDELCKDDVAVLAGLPTLVRLVLFARHVPDEGIDFGSDTTFRTLDYFESPQADLTFQAGALPKVQTLRLQMDVHEIKTCGFRVSGMEHLPNLKNIAIGLGYSSSEESDVPIVEEAIRSFFGQHPGRLTIHITNYLY